MGNFQYHKFPPLMREDTSPFPEFLKIERILPQRKVQIFQNKLSNDRKNLIPGCSARKVVIFESPHNLSLQRLKKFREKVLGCKSFCYKMKNCNIQKANIDLVSNWLKKNNKLHDFILEISEFKFSGYNEDFLAELLYCLKRFRTLKRITICIESFGEIEDSAINRFLLYLSHNIKHLTGLKYFRLEISTSIFIDSEVLEEFCSSLEHLTQLRLLALKLYTRQFSQDIEPFIFKAISKLNFLEVLVLSLKQINDDENTLNHRCMDEPMHYIASSFSKLIHLTN